MTRAALVVLACTASCAGSPSRSGAPLAPIHLALPAVDGGTVDLARYRGKPVLLHVFTTWDTSATGDVDQLVALHEARGQDLTIIGIALDRDGHRLVNPWRRALGVRYLVALATDAVRAGASALGPLTQVPATFVLDARGRVLRRIDRPLAPDEAASLVPEQ